MELADVKGTVCASRISEIREGIQKLFGSMRREMKGRRQLDLLKAIRARTTQKNRSVRMKQQSRWPVTTGHRDCFAEVDSSGYLPGIFVGGFFCNSCFSTSIAFSS